MFQNMNFITTRKALSSIELFYVLESYSVNFGTRCETVVLRCLSIFFCLDTQVMEHIIFSLLWHNFTLRVSDFN